MKLEGVVGSCLRDLLDLSCLGDFAGTIFPPQLWKQPIRARQHAVFIFILQGLPLSNLHAGRGRRVKGSWRYVCLLRVGGWVNDI